MAPPLMRGVGNGRVELALAKSEIICQISFSGALSSLLLVLDVAADDLGDVGVLFLGLLDEGVVVLVAALHLDVLDVLASLGGRLLGATLDLGIGLLERHELGLVRLRLALG